MTKRKKNKGKPKVNQHGLSRYIPDDIKRAIRQECGFGCVVCGEGVYEYEHIEPEFREAKEHNPATMALLCGRCHGHVTRRQWSKTKVMEARLNPRCLQQGFSRWDLDYSLALPTVKFGSAVLIAPKTVISLFGRNVLAIAPPEMPGSPVRISAELYDSSERLMLGIVENELRTQVGSWDVETVGQALTIRRGPKEEVLRLVLTPRSEIAVEKLEMHLEGMRMSVDERGLRLGLARWQCDLTRFSGEIRDADCCFEISKNGLPLPYWGRVEADFNAFMNLQFRHALPGEKINFTRQRYDGIDIRVGVGASYVWCGNFQW